MNSGTALVPRVYRARFTIDSNPYKGCLMEAMVLCIAVQVSFLKDLLVQHY